ncbi:uncharacterized protein LAESUDRAFT_713795 [Laetiporus sulphureus 93-53]|uniref:Uncharacterized protein n=1 Tax=Laetiporus sulphureus 93-53 TaxID=1314785 RepID=A0A165EM94_9APHY|nr:uncharacterized protein LAESUDRAFT_713795 [Laetiporus sulphureus 93-53]KZT07354.1 hypothetical protein LAESUDRAFT_713795 [Laetiporus sulphureus 93-53]
MRASYALLLPLFSFGVAHTASIKRQDQSPETGTIVNPAVGTAIDPGASFAFNYSTNNWCHQGYSLFTVWLTPGPDAPTYADVTSTNGNAGDSVGILEEGTYLYDFGEFVVNNFRRLADLAIEAGELPPTSTPPPAALTMPNLLELNGTSYSNATFYIAVVDTFQDCPPSVPIELGLTSHSIVYNATTST